MDMYFFEFDILEKELSELPQFHQVAFVASCCERMLPNYNAFCHIYDWGDPNLARTALDEVWQMLQGKPVEEVIIEQLIEACGSEDIFPSDLDFGGEYCTEAQDALQALIYTLCVLREPNLQYILKVVKSARRTIEAFIPDSESSFNVDWKKDGIEKYKEAIASHPFAVREIAKEAEDLQRLKETEILDRDFLEWLRTSFDNDGKSLIDLG
jgi:hypothetical protein